MNEWVPRPSCMAESMVNKTQSCNISTALYQNHVKISNIYDPNKSRPFELVGFCLCKVVDVDSGWDNLSWSLDLKLKKLAFDTIGTCQTFVAQKKPLGCRRDGNRVCNEYTRIQLASGRERIECESK